MVQKICSRCRFSFRSTPMPDSFFGGKDDLTAALGYEEDGVTTIVFRKKLEGEAREKSSTRLL